MLGSLLGVGNGYVSNATSPAFQRFQELGRICGITRSYTLSVKLGLYTMIKEARSPSAESVGKKGLG